MYVCVCVCVCARARACACVCMFVCVYKYIDLQWIPRASSCESVRSADEPPFRLGLR